MRILVIGAFLCAALSGGASGQRIDGGRAGVTRPSFRGADSVAQSAEPSRTTPLRVSPRVRAYAPLASAIVPGSGQFMLGKDRFIGYAAIEALAWVQYSRNARDQAIQESKFRDLARHVARASFSPNGPDGGWTYYEAMRDHLESGSYSLSPSGPVVPETDPATFNGKTWLDALSTNPDPASALAQYERLAVKPEFQWSWNNAQLQWDIFKRTTFKRDDAHYAAFEDLAVIGANHLLSMVDAFATLRLEVRTRPNGETAVGARLRW